MWILRATTVVVVLLSGELVLVPRAAIANTDLGLEHAYFECDKPARQDESRPYADRNCRQVLYSVTPDRIALVLRDPQLADRVPSKALKLKTAGGRTLAAVCRPPEGENLLELVSLDKENPRIAAYKVNSCTAEIELVWLARLLASRLGEVETGGLLARMPSLSGQLVIVDELMVGVREEIALPLSPDNRALLDAFGLDFVAPDPFDARRALLRSSLEEEKPQASDASHLVGMDVVSCLLAASVNGADSSAKTGCLDVGVGSQGLSTGGESLRSMYESRHSNTSKRFGGKGTFGEALEGFLKLHPWLLRPQFLSVSLKGAPAEFNTWLAAEKKAEDNLTASITFNSTSNETDIEDQARLSIDAAASRGTYPSQLRLDLGAQVEFDDNQVEENVTDILLNYEHYFSPWFMIYGFAERFSNSFLAIDQRWEGGGGVLFEYDLRTKQRDTFCKTQGLQRGYQGKDVFLTPKARRHVEQLRQSVRDALLRTGLVPRDKAAEYCSYFPGIAKRRAKLQLSLAISVFSDFEQPDELELVLQNVDGEDNPIESDFKADSVKLAPQASQLGRLTLRPTITFRPTDGLSLIAYHYYKWSFDSDEPLQPSGSDEREQSTLEAELKLSAKVSLTGSVTLFSDSQPPRLSAASVFDSLGFMTNGDGPAFERPQPLADTFFGTADGMNFLRVSGLAAQRDHRVVKFGAKISF